MVGGGEKKPIDFYSICLSLSSDNYLMEIVLLLLSSADGAFNNCH